MTQFLDASRHRVKSKHSNVLIAQSLPTVEYAVFCEQVDFTADCVSAAGCGNDGAATHVEYLEKSGNFAGKIREIVVCL